MLDANEGVIAQDTKIAGFANDKGKALVIRRQQVGYCPKRDGNDGKAEKGYLPRPVIYGFCAYRIHIGKNRPARR